MPEQRKHLRLPVESRTFIELVSPQLGTEGTGRLVTCQTLNISRGGLQVTLGEPVVVGAILQISVELPGEEHPLYLAGEVRWCEANDQEPERPWCAGFQLLNAGSTDIERWTQLIAAMEA
ncbi:MAG: PilZ domain-containing protein [Halioglobus sp.]|nr:PilZ domain-containing protein [Halioglobus sp.]